MIFYWDIETFKNFFSVLFISEDYTDEYIFIKYKDRDDIPALCQFVSQPGLVLIGYNSTFYDDFMMKAVLKKPDITNRQLYNTSKKLIETRKLSDLPKGMKDIAYAETPWTTVDLMAVLKINTNRPSLKHCAIHLEHDKLEDLPKSPDADVEPHEVDTIIKYNRNDVVITGKLWNLLKIQEAINLRRKMGEKYGVSLLSADDSKIGNVILESAYGTPERRATRRELIKGVDLIPPGLSFETEVMQAVLHKIERLTLVEVKTKTDKFIHLVYPRRTKFEIKFEFNGLGFKMAKGGLHSDDPPRTLTSTDTLKYRDADVGSYYPMLRQVYKLVPEHLDKERFLEVDKMLIETRLEAKHSGDKVTADGLKICINGIFGKYNYDGFWLYDPLCLYQTTIYGQLFLLKLIEMLHLGGIKTVSANTDGIVCEIPDYLEDDYYRICKEWEVITGMSLEYNDYKKLVTLNVNSYMGIMVNGKDPKTKKDFSDNKKLEKSSFVKGYQAPVIAIALQRYFEHGTLPETTIMGHTNIHDFFYTQKTGGKFYMVFVTSDGVEIRLQKTNRFYITFSGGVLVKKDKTKYELVDDDDSDDDWYFDDEYSETTRETSIWKGQYVHVLNDIPENRDDLPEIKRQFYVDKVWDIIKKIEPEEPELSIFDFM